MTVKMYLPLAEKLMEKYFDGNQVDAEAGTHCSYMYNVLIDWYTLVMKISNVKINVVVRLWFMQRFVCFSWCWIEERMHRGNWKFCVDLQVCTCIWMAI